MSRTHVAAIDLGASSGRVVLGEVTSSSLRVEAVARFGNDPVLLPDGLHWDLLGLYARALDGLREAVRRSASEEVGLSAVGVDSWAVDYGLLRAGRLLGTPYHYRDERRGAQGPDLVHARVGREELFERNGLQFLPFNTLYQLAADPVVADGDSLLLVPDLIGWALTGQVVTERTNASTTGLLDPRTGAWDLALAQRLGLHDGLLGPLVNPGETVGELLPHVAQHVASPGLSVTAVGSHDTASAVVGVPIQSDDAAYISCGTWGLVGVELDEPVLSEAARAANFTNEGGVDGRTRFLTNVMGTWLLSETLRTWGRRGEPDDLGKLLAAASDVTDHIAVFDVQDPRFLPPGDMADRICAWFTERDLEPPRTRAALVRTIVESLAQAYAEAVDAAQRLSGHRVGTVHVVGGGAQNRLLCRSLARRSGRTVLAGPVEATSIGNVLVQARSVGALRGGLETLRELVAQTQDVARFYP